MNKNFINFLTFSIAILGGGGTALNSSICYSMDSNNINTNSINEDNINLNVITEPPQHNNNRIQNNNYSSAELISTTNKLVRGAYQVTDNNRKNITQEIENYLNNIRGFYNSNDTNILQQLTSIVHNTMNNKSWSHVKTDVLSNLEELLTENIITTYEYEDLLIFNLFLNIMTSIEHTGEKVWLNKSTNKWLLHDTPINIDGKQWFINKYDIKGTSYEQLLEPDTDYIIQKLTNLLISKYFVLDDPNTWIAQDRLIAKIKDNIRNLCDVFDDLPIAKQLLNNKNTTTYEAMPAGMFHVSNEIDKYFNRTEVEAKLVKELKTVFRDAQYNKMYEKTGINSKYILQSIGNDYIKDKKLLNKLAKHQAFPTGLFDDPKGIPSIVLSYLKDKLEDGQTWIVPKPIYSYMKKYNLIHEQQSDEDKSSDENDSEYDDRY